MSKEFHNDFLHILVDCKSGNVDFDKGIENMIMAYANLVAYCVTTEKLNELITEMQRLAENYRKEELKKRQ